jgi:hypothetical protein
MSAVAIQIETPFRRSARKTARPSLRMIAAWSLLGLSIPTLIGWWLAASWLAASIFKLLAPLF